MLELGCFHQPLKTPQNMRVRFHVSQQIRVPPQTQLHLYDTNPEPALSLGCLHQQILL